MATSCPRMQVPSTEITRCAAASPCAHNWKVPGQAHHSLLACGGRLPLSGRSAFRGARHSAVQEERDNWAQLGIFHRSWRSRCTGRRTVGVCSGARFGAIDGVVSKLELERAPKRSAQSSLPHSSRASRTVVASSKRYSSNAAPCFVARNAKALRLGNRQLGAANWDQVTVGATEEPMPKRTHLPSSASIGSPEDPTALPGLEVLEDIFDPQQKGKPAFGAPLNAGSFIVAEPESPPKLHVLEELLSEGDGVKGAAQGLAGPIDQGRGSEVAKVGSGDNVRNEEVGRSKSGGLGINRQKWRRPASEGGVAKGNGVSASEERGGYSYSTLEAAIRTVTGSKRDIGAIGGRGLRERASDPPSKAPIDAALLGGRNVQAPDGGRSGEEVWASTSPPKGESRQNRVVGKSAASTGASQAAEKSVLRSRSVDTQASGVPGAWAQWLNSVSERKGAEEQNGTKEKLRMQTGNSEGVGDQQVREGQETGGGYAVTGGVRMGLERHSGSAAESGQEFGAEWGGDSEEVSGRLPERDSEGLRREEDGELFSKPESGKVHGLDDQIEGVWSSDEDGEVSQTGSRRVAAAKVRNPRENGVHFFAEGSQTTEEPLPRRRPLAYEKLSPSELFGEEPFEAVAAGNGLKEASSKEGGRGESRELEGLEEDFAEEDGDLVEGNDVGRGKRFKVVQGGSRNAVGMGDDGELSERVPSWGGALGIPRKLKGAETGRGRAWAVDTRLGPNEEAVAGVNSVEQAARKSRLESGLGDGQPGTRAWTASDRSGSASGLGSRFDGRPQGPRQGRADAIEKQGRFAETKASRGFAEPGVDGKEEREAARAAAKDRAWAAWQEFSSGGDQSPQEMSEFLAKWTAENAGGEKGNEEAWEETRFLGGEAGKRREGVSGWEGYSSDADGERGEGSYSGFAERAAPRKVFVRGGTPGGARREAINGSRGYGSDADGERSKGSGFAKTAAPGKVFVRGAAQGTPGIVRSESSGRGREVRPVAESLRSVEEADRPGFERPRGVRPKKVEYGSREDNPREGGRDRALSEPPIGGVRASENITPRSPATGRQKAGDPPIAIEPNRDTWVRRPDVNEGPGPKADVTLAFGAADVSENCNEAAAAGSEVSAASGEALEWGVNEGADPDWVGDDQSGADTWQGWEVEDDDDIVQPTETDWQKVFVAAAARRLQRAGREPETEPEPADFPAEAALGGSPRASFEELSEEEQKALLLRESLDLSVRNRVQKLKDSRPRKKPRDERTMEERGFAVFLEVLPELERQKLLCQKIKSGQLVWAPCCVYYVIHHSHTEILRFFNARTRALARQWKLGYSATKALNYYMRSSCALTLAIKNQLKSRAAAYRKWGRELTDPVTRAKFEMKTPIPLGGWDTIDWDRPVGVRAVGGGYYTPEEMRVRTRMVPQPITWKIPTVNDPTLGGKWDLGIETPQKVRQRAKPDGGRRGRR